MRSIFNISPGLLHRSDHQRQHQLLPHVKAHVPTPAGYDGDQSCGAPRSRRFGAPVCRILPQCLAAHVSPKHSRTTCYQTLLNPDSCMRVQSLGSLPGSSFVESKYNLCFVQFYGKSRTRLCVCVCVLLEKQ